MKFKYYLRGVGVGLIVSSILFAIAFALYQPKMSDEEIIAAAKNLGMVAEEESDTDATNSSKAEENTDASEGDSSDTNGEDTSDVTYVEFTIAGGDSSATVSKHLEEAGLVDNADSFDLYLSDQNLDNSLLPGTYSIAHGSTFLEIGQILTTKQ